MRGLEAQLNKERKPRRWRRRHCSDSPRAVVLRKGEEIRWCAFLLFPVLRPVAEALGETGLSPPGELGREEPHSAHVDGPGALLWSNQQSFPFHVLFTWSALELFRESGFLDAVELSSWQGLAFIVFDRFNEAGFENVSMTAVKC